MIVLALFVHSILIKICNVTNSQCPTHIQTQDEEVMHVSMHDTHANTVVHVLNMKFKYVGNSLRPVIVSMH